MNDDQLHRVLNHHPARVRLPKAFNREVWGRIEAEDSLSFYACAKMVGLRMLAWLAQPCAGASVLALSMVFGAWLGVTTTQLCPEAEALRYVQSIRP